MKLLLVCSTGSYFNAMQQLQSFWRHHDRIWVTFRVGVTEAALIEERVYWAFSPINSNLLNLIRNFWLAWKVLSQERPQVVLSTGAGVAVPFLILGKLMGCQTAFVESITRTRKASMSARLTLPFLNVLYVYWHQLQARYPKAELIVPRQIEYETQIFAKPD